MNKFKFYPIYIFVSYILILIFTILSAVIFTYTNINDKYINIFVYGILAISVFIPSILLNRKIKSKGIITGGIFGILVYATMYIISAIFLTGGTVSMTMLVPLLISVIAGVLGGMIGVNI